MTAAHDPARALVTVVWVPVTRASADHFVKCVSRTETARAERYRRQEDRDRSVVAAGALRQVVAELTGGTPQEMRVDRACAWCGEAHGRPTVPGTGLEVSVSHTGHWAVVAHSRAGAVGVDAEASGRAGRLPRDIILAPHERVADEADLLDRWVAKEAYLKAIGTGLTVSPSTVTIDGDRVSAPDHPPGRLGRLACRPGHAAAVCLMGTTEPQVVERELSVASRHDPT